MLYYENIYKKRMDLIHKKLNNDDDEEENRGNTDSNTH